MIAFKTVIYITDSWIYFLSVTKSFTLSTYIVHFIVLKKNSDSYTLFMWLLKTNCSELYSQFWIIFYFSGMPIRPVSTLVVYKNIYKEETLVT